RRDLSIRIEGLNMASEPANEAEPHGPQISFPAGQHGPGEREVAGDAARASALEIIDEARQHAGGVLELESDRAAQRDVFSERGAQRDHDSTPGHGSASARRAPRSTLA